MPETQELVAALSNPSQPFQPASCAIRPLPAAAEAAWDEYVLAHPHGSPFHLIAWKRSIEEVFGYQPQYCAAFEGERIRGILPLFLVKNPLLGSALISSPFAVYGGVLADSDEIRAIFREYVEKLGRSLGVQYVELRNAYPEQGLGFSPVARYVTFTQQVGPDEAALLESIPRKTRRMVRKSLEQGFTVRTQETDFHAFEDLYSRNLRRLGTPSFPPQHFACLLKHFRGMAGIREILLKDNMTAAVFTFYFRDQVLPYYGASDPAFNAAAPNNFMYYDLMRWAGQSGFAVFDFGRSKISGSGSFDFKAHWGMTQRELPYEMLLVKRKELPNFSPNNRAFQLPIRMWQHLPLWITRALGPVFVKWVP